MLCIHIIHEHEHAWTWYGYVFMCVHVCSCMSMYVHVYLYVSALFTKQKPKYISNICACQWIIAFNGTAERLSRALRTPLNSGGFHLFIPCWATNLRSFMMFSQGSCCRIKWMWWWPFRGFIQSCTSIHFWFHGHDHDQRTLAATMAVLISREPSLSVGSQLEQFILLVGWYLGVPEIRIFTAALWIPALLWGANSFPDDFKVFDDEFPSECSRWVPVVHAPWIMTLQNIQHSTCATLSWT